MGTQYGYNAPVEFIESPLFTRDRPDYLSDDELAEFLEFLSRNPEYGDMIPGTRGFRKIRWANRRRGKGKRSGSRTIYLFAPVADRIHLALIYDHERQDDLSAADRRELAGWADELKERARKDHEARGRAKEGKTPDSSRKGTKP